MIYSMTGYAAASQEMNDASLQIELKAVNSRYLDIQFRLADELRTLEPALRDALSAQVSRGKLECRINLIRDASKKRSQSMSAPRLAELKSLESTIRQNFPDASPLSVSHILSWPGLFEEEPIDAKALAANVLALFNTALSDFSASRAREGEKLKAVILDSVELMRVEMRQVLPHLDTAQEMFQEKLKRRLLDALKLADDERIRQEVAIFAMRIDVTEELARLSTHLDEVTRVLTTGGASGKRLDFLMQELNREANTLGSKSVMAKVSQTAMNLKLLIEQMREQIQNLE